MAKREREEGLDDLCRSVKRLQTAASENLEQRFSEAASYGPVKPSILNAYRPVHQQHGNNGQALQPAQLNAPGGFAFADAQAALHPSLAAAQEEEWAYRQANLMLKQLHDDRQARLNAHT